jgi:hypothetical protein
MPNSLTLEFRCAAFLPSPKRRGIGSAHGGEGWIKQDNIGMPNSSYGSAAKTKKATRRWLFNLLAINQEVII